MERLAPGPSPITINRNDRFVVCRVDGTIGGAANEGFYTRDTRFVSGYRLWINGEAPVFLTSAATHFFASRFEFSNPELFDAVGPIPASTLSLRLDRTIAEGVHEDLDLVSFARRPVTIALDIELDSDFADLFDVAVPRLIRRGIIQSRWFSSRRELRTTYRNAGFVRTLIASIERAGSTPQWANGRLSFAIRLEQGQAFHTCLKWLPVVNPRRRPTTLGCNAITEERAGFHPPKLPRVGIHTPNEIVERAWAQAVHDMEALRLEEDGAGKGVFIPAAGIPWFATLFGRDSLIVSMQSISGYPEFSAGALRRLSELQANRDDPDRDMEPGKIPHEIRHGELATLGMIPHQPYYGTHDATSLFIVVLSYLYQWTGDAAILERYLPSAEAAMAWIDRFGDRDGDGFQEYATRSPRGYYNQGWKDAGDAVIDAAGVIAPLPIATCELQGYAYDAKLRLAEIYDVLGMPDRSGPLLEQAQRLYERFNDAFWWEREGTYALALDGRKRQVRSVASNAGHCLSSGIVPQGRARKVADRLMADDMWSGWGIRTLSAAHSYYNPFSYHTGSVWPHDNAMIAGGFRRYGFDAEAGVVARGMFDAAAQFGSNRLPELFSGLGRDRGAFPVPYLGASAPQAWAAASVFRFVAILCGIHATVTTEGERQLYVNPALPDWLPELTITHLRAGRGAMSLRFQADEVEELSNSTGYRLVRAPAPRRAPPPLRRGSRRSAAPEPPGPAAPQ
ncbi:MAG TPA: glycogen debranching N-terminal domain-containing protein [Candidatus Limnocylindrales bacterium]|nr:glycogen debranching N-terminal domain-containing protein [Candidatus Limnocylindrales bacterium]